jgi:hypothetical protein
MIIQSVIYEPTNQSSIVHNLRGPIVEAFDLKPLKSRTTGVSQLQSWNGLRLSRLGMENPTPDTFQPSTVKTFSPLQRRVLQVSHLVPIPLQ